jgi:hypothetical protein
MFFSSPPSFLYLIPAVFYVANLLLMVIGKQEQEEVCFKQAENVLLVKEIPVQHTSLVVFEEHIVGNFDVCSFSDNEWFIPPDIQAAPDTYMVFAVEPICPFSAFSRPPPRV